MITNTYWIYVYVLVLHSDLKNKNSSCSGYPVVALQREWPGRYRNRIWMSLWGFHFAFTLSVLSPEDTQSCPKNHKPPSPQTWDSTHGLRRLSFTYHNFTHKKCVNCDIYKFWKITIVVHLVHLMSFLDKFQSSSFI